VNDKASQFLLRSVHGYSLDIGSKSGEEICNSIKKRLLTYPIFIKPISGFASIGIHKVDNLNSLKVVVDTIITERKKYPILMKKILVQEFVSGED
jgi:D-alanine-D-alanine ligase-like ATP-grasp enzyme